METGERSGSLLRGVRLLEPHAQGSLFILFALSRNCLGSPADPDHLLSLLLEMRISDVRPSENVILYRHRILCWLTQELSNDGKLSATDLFKKINALTLYKSRKL